MLETPSGAAAAPPSTAELRERVDAIPIWYHTFDFGDGVVSNGYFDHTRLVSKLPLPESMEGMRCLDLASSDGFFAFEMAKRGGDVVSVDLENARAQDWPAPGPPPEADRSGALERFETARWATGLEVERVECNLYDVTPEELGEFDFVFIGNILLHLSDPVSALRAARAVTRGRLVSFETVSLALTLLRPRTSAALLGEIPEPRWWTTNTRGHRRLLTSTGFKVEDTGFPLLQPFGTGFKSITPKLRRAEGTPLGTHLAFVLFNRPFGVPCQWVLCS